MNWGAMGSGLGLLGGAGLAAMFPPAGMAVLPAMAAGGGLGSAAGGLAGQFAPKDMPPPAGAPPGAKPPTPQMGQQPSLAQQLQQNLTPGQGGFLKRPFV